MTVSSSMSTSESESLSTTTASSSRPMPLICTTSHLCHNLVRSRSQTYTEAYEKRNQVKLNEKLEGGSKLFLPVDSTVLSSS